MFDHEMIKKYAFEDIPLNRDIYLMEEQWIHPYEAALVKLCNGGEFDNVGSIAYASARKIDTDSIALSWYPNIYDRFHEVRVILPRSQFITCTECEEYDEKPRIFVRDDWLTDLYMRTYSVFALIDAIGVKVALANGTLTHHKLIRLRDRLDEIATRHPQFAFISFADNLLIKGNWYVGRWDSDTKYTYEPEEIVKLLPEINTAYLEILGMSVYAVITQGHNEYYSDELLHISTTQNHISLNCLGLSFAQVLVMDSNIRQSIRNKIHAPAEVYMDEHFFRSLRLDYKYKDGLPKYSYDAPMTSSPSYYFLECRQNLLSNLQSAPTQEI